jgi:hypothetical protein
MMGEPVRWLDEAQQVISGDITAAAYLTPAGGAVVTAVAPFGIADRGRGMVGFTTSLGFPGNSNGSLVTRAWRWPITRVSTGFRRCPGSCWLRAARR